MVNVCIDRYQKPNDPCIEVRVLNDIGERIVVCDDKETNFAGDTMHFQKRIDADQFI